MGGGLESGRFPCQCICTLLRYSNGVRRQKREDLRPQCIAVSSKVKEELLK